MTVSAPPRLRDYQQAQSDALDAAEREGESKRAVIAATGLGKGNLIANRAGAGTLFLSHREELVAEIADRIAEIFPGRSCGIVQGNRNQCRHEVISASMQTLSGRYGAGRRQAIEKPRKVVIDEAHHACSPSYVEILEWAGCFDDRNPTPLEGVTATMNRAGPPKRGELGLGDIWKHICEPKLDIRWGVSYGPAPWDAWTTVPTSDNGGRGWLITPRGRSVVLDHLDLDNAKVNKGRGDYQDADLGEMVAADAEQLVDAWLENAVDAENPLGRITAAFVPSKAAAFALNDAFNLRGVAAEVVVGETTRAERGSARRKTGIYGRLAMGVTRVLVGVMVPTEGWDCPEVSCILWARPTMLAHLYIQGVGRGLRPAPWVGKRDCLILDAVGAARVNSLVIAPQLLPGIEYNDQDLGDAVCLRCTLPIALCQCLVEPAEPRVDRRRKLEQPIYVDIELFHETELNWQRTIEGYKFLSIPKTRQFVVLYEEGDGSVAVGLMNQGGGGEWLHVGCTPAQGQAHAEAEARERNDGGPGLDRKASWRVGAPKPGAIEAGRKWCIENPEGMTAGRLSDEISSRACSAALRRT